MKKIYLSIFLIGLTATASHAQLNSKPYNFVDANESIKPTAIQGAQKALGIQIWADDFTNGANWTIDNDGQTDPAYGWTIDGTVDGWWSTNGITSASGAPYAELSNGTSPSNPNNSALDVTYTMTSITLDIPNLPGNTSNTDQATLQYQEYGALFNDQQTVEISVDGGTTWTEMRDNRDFSTVLSASGGSAYPNPRNVSINLAPYITGNASQVQIRFAWTTAFPQSSTNPAVWITYGWFIDNVRIFTNPDNDITAIEPYWGTASLNYSKIPTTQIAPVDFTTRAFNNGLNTQTNVELNVDINSGAWTGVSQSVSIPVGAYDSLVVAPQYTPAATPGMHTFTWEITQNEIDDVPANNILTGDSFEITDYIYAMDDNTVSGSSGNGGFGWEKGNFYDIWADQDVYYIDVKLHSTSVVGSNVYGKIYKWDATSANTFADALFYVQQTDYHVVTQADLAQGVISLPLLAPTTLTAADNTYFVVAATDGDGGTTNDVQIATSGISPSGFSYFYAVDDNAWYLQPATPIVRLNFDGTAWGLNEATNVTALNIFPNPAADQVSISFNVGEASDVLVEVLDMTGKVIETVSNDSQVSGLQNSMVDVANYAAGMYLINIETKEGSVQRKFVKK